MKERKKVMTLSRMVACRNKNNKIVILLTVVIDTPSVGRMMTWNMHSAHSVNRNQELFFAFYC